MQSNFEDILSPKQLHAYTKSYSRINILEGAVSSGKTYILMYRFLEELRNGPPGPYMIGGRSETTVIRNVLKPIMNELGEGMISYNQSRREFTLFGKEVYIVGASDERAEGRIRGLTLGCAMIDEASLIPESFFKMTLSRLRIPDSKLFASTNPDSCHHWLKTDFIDKFADDPEELASFHFKLDDNPFLTQKYKDSLKKEYSGLWYRRFINGEWVQAEGAIFDFFEPDIHCVKTAPSYAKYYILGIDYGTTNPFAAVLVGFNDDVHPALWVEKEFYWDSKVTGRQKTDAEYSRDIKREFEGYPIKMSYLDPSAKSFEIELKRQRWPVLQAKNDVLDGIRTVSTYLSQGDLVILKKCKNIIREFESYVWDVRSDKVGIDKPIKMRDHLLDALRYALHTKYGEKHTLKELSQEEAFMRGEQRRFQENPMNYPGYTDSPGWQSFNGNFR